MQLNLQVQHPNKCLWKKKSNQNKQKLLNLLQLLNKLLHHLQKKLQKLKNQNKLQKLNLLRPHQLRDHKLGNLCQDWDKESPKDLNNPKIPMLYWLHSNKSTCMKLLTLAKYKSLYIVNWIRLLKEIQRKTWFHVFLLESSHIGTSGVPNCELCYRW